MRPRAALVVAMLLCTGRASRADDLSLMDPAAKTYLERGAQFFADKQYTLAVAEFEHGYSVEPDIAFLFAWAQSERLRGNCYAAAPLYKKLLASHPPPQQEVVAKFHLGVCRAILPRPWYRDPVGDTLVLAGLAGVGTGIGLFFTAQSANDVAGRASDYRSFHDASVTSQHERIGAIVSVSLGAALIAAGVLELPIANRSHKRRVVPPMETSR